MPTPEAQPCAECGAPLADGADGGVGLCIRCVVRGALDLDGPEAGSHDRNEGRAGEGGSPPGKLGWVGEYEILEEIARGGMGVVYRACQPALGRVVALKVLLGGGFAGESGRRRLQAEAAAAARLRHPRIVGVLDAGVADGQPFYTMEYVEGRPLSEFTLHGPLPAGRAAEYVAAVAEAVQYAHSQGVLHRDLKPSNVIVDREDQPRITDFGLAKVGTPPEAGAGPGTASAGERFGVRTLTGEILGSPAYMSPEQALGRSAEVGPASEVYALGAILYELLTSRPPFLGETPLAVLEQVGSADPLPLRRLNPGVPKDLETLCLKCLEKSPAARFASAGELADDLRRFLRGEPVRARPLGPAARGWRWVRRKPLVAALSALSLVLLGAGLAVTAVSGWRIRESRDEARARLAESLVAEAHALRWAGQPGHRERALDRLSEAGALRPDPPLRRRLQRETIAALGLADVRRVTVPSLPPCADLMLVCFDRSFTRCALARGDAEGGTGVEVWSVPDGNQTGVLPVPRPDEIQAFSPDGRWLVLRYGASMAVADVGAGDGRMVLEAEPGGGTSFASGGFSEDGRWFARGERGGLVAVYPVPASASGEAGSAEGWRAAWRWTTPGGSAVRLLVWSPEGRQVALATADDRVAVVEVQSGKVVWERETRGAWNMAWNRGMDAVVFHVSPNQIRFLAAGDGTEVGVLRAPDEDGTAIAFSADGAVMANASPGWGIRLSDPVTGQALGGDTAGAWHLHFDPAGLRVGTLIDGGRPAWLERLPSSVMTPLRAGSPALSHQDPVFDAAGRRLMARVGSGVVLWSVPSGTLVGERVLPRLQDAVFDRTEARLVVATGGELREIAVPGTPDRGEAGNGGRLLAEGRRFWTVAVSPGQGWVAGADSQGGTVVVVDPRGGRTRTLAAPLVPGYVAFSPDDRWLACGAGTRVYLWSTERWEEPPRVLEGVGERVRFSPEGRWLVTLGRTVELWEPASGRRGPDLPLEAENDPVAMAAISPDGRWLAATQRHREVHLVDLATRETLAVLEGPGDRRVIGLAFGGGGRFLAAARAFGEIQLWDLDALRRELAARDLGW